MKWNMQLLYRRNRNSVRDLKHCSRHALVATTYLFIRGSQPFFCAPAEGLLQTPYVPHPHRMVFYSQLTRRSAVDYKTSSKPEYTHASGQKPYVP